MAKITQYQQDAIDVLRARLDVNHPFFCATAEVARALKDARIYIDSWVLPLLDVIEGGSFYGHREYVARDAASARIALRRAAK
jgi:hypothetical protein